MDDKYKVLRFHWRGKNVDIRVEIDKCSLLDIVIEYEDEAKKLGQKLEFHFPTFSYVFECQKQELETNKDLMKMFNEDAPKPNITEVNEAMQTKSSAKVLRFDWRGKILDIGVEVDKCSLLDIVMEYEDEAKKLGQKLEFHFPTFAYAFNETSQKLETDKDLMSMFDRFSEKNLIYIYVGTVIRPYPLYKLVMNIREKSQCKKIVESDAVNEHENDLPSIDDLEDTSVNPSINDLVDTPVNHAATKDAPKPNITEVNEATQTKASTKGGKHTISKAKSAKAQTSTDELSPPSISRYSAFKSLIGRRSPRFPPTHNISFTFTVPVSDQSLFTQKIPKTTAKRKRSCTYLQNVGMSTTSESGIELGESRKMGGLIGKEMRATDEPVVIIDPRVSDQSNEAKTAAKVAPTTEGQKKKVTSTKKGKAGKVKELSSQGDGSDNDLENINSQPIELIDLITDSDLSRDSETGMKLDNATYVPTKSVGKSVFSATRVPTQDIVLALPAFRRTNQEHEAST